MNHTGSAHTLRWRLIGALAIIAPVLGLLWLDARVNFGRPGIWLLPFGAIVTGTALWELNHMASAAGQTRFPAFRSILLGELSLAIAGLPIVFPGVRTALPDVWAWAAMGIMASLMAGLLCAMVRFRTTRGVTNDAAIDHFHGVMIVLPLLFLLHVRLAWPDVRGLWVMASIPWITKVSDAGAFFAGRTLGMRKMAPRLSPKKTWAGAIGGTVAAACAAVAFLMVVRLIFADQLAGHVSWVEITVFGVLLALAGILGDLAESLLKRDAGLKDSSAWLPGLGGTLDVVDSILWTAPIGYACWMLWLGR